jgi:hypothetical protein
MDSLKILNKSKSKNCFILLENNKEQERSSDGKHSFDRLLQSEMPLLFCSKDDGAKKK